MTLMIGCVKVGGKWRVSPCDSDVWLCKGRWAMKGLSL